VGQVTLQDCSQSVVTLAKCVLTRRSPKHCEHDNLVVFALATCQDVPRKQPCLPQHPIARNQAEHSNKLPGFAVDDEYFHQLPIPVNCGELLLRKSQHTSSSRGWRSEARSPVRLRLRRSASRKCDWDPHLHIRPVEIPRPSK